ncbi:MAG: hypothetical protein ACFCD0_16300 [Gemmataceae bacterium]
MSTAVVENSLASQVSKLGEGGTNPTFVVKILLVRDDQARLVVIEEPGSLQGLPVVEELLGSESIGWFWVSCLR